MAIFRKKTKTQGFEHELTVLRQRVEALDIKRRNAEAELTAATEARQRHHIEGDLDDADTAQTLQDRVNDAASRVVGLEDAIAVVQSQIADFEQKLTAERTQAERNAAAEKLTHDVAEMEAALPDYLAASRRLADAMGATGFWHFESGAIETFARSAQAQIETAAAFAVQDMRRIITDIGKGSAPIPPAQPEAVVALPAAAEPEPAFKYHTLKGRPMFNGATARSPKADPALAAAKFTEIDRSAEARTIQIDVPRT